MLPEPIRNEVCRRLAAGAQLLHVTNWLNGLPEVWQAMADKFGGAIIHTINVRCWKITGFIDWQIAQRPAVQVAQLPAPAPQKKIDRLSAELREALCQRIHAGESSVSIHAWLNGLPAVRAMLAQFFRGLNISHADLKDWRESGYVEWAKPRGLYSHHLGRKVITGKIASLPQAIRDELCQRMHSGEFSTAILEWLNAVPAVKDIIADAFSGSPINLVNLSTWRGTGYKSWLAAHGLEFPATDNRNQRGKIAQLPAPIREEICQRIKSGQPAVEILAWVNTQPQVEAILKSHFDGCPINAVNLSWWRNAGFQDWINAQPNKHETIRDTAKNQNPLAAQSPARCT